jgi:CBS domain-containing protein
MATPRLVSDIMTKNVVSVSDDQTLADLRENMRNMRFRHTPVTDEGRLVGLVTERDLLRMSTSSLLPYRESDTFLQQQFHARDVMTKDVATVSPSTTLKRAGEQMLEKRIGCLPVVDEKNMLVGIVTTSDFLRIAIGLLPDAV